ncbi:MAG: hypothetical protein NZM37_11775, partial [Sandaracinaceae bacterium]|nr:hypothetical protein [Sandaracinaceae bacterium]
RKTNDGEYALVVINTQERHPSRTRFGDHVMRIQRPEGSVLVDVITGERFTVGREGQLEVEVGTLVDEDPATPTRVRVLLPEDQVRPEDLFVR